MMVQIPFFLCASIRSGSHFFINLFNSSGKTEKLMTYLSDARGLKTDEERLSYWENIPVNMDNTWGIKVNLHDLPTVARYLSLKKISPSSIKWIYLRRKDKIAQAISHYRMSITKILHIWEATSQEEKNKANADIEIPPNKLARLIVFHFFVESAWENFFRINGIKPYMLFYEDFIEKSQWTSTIKSVLDFLEIPSDDKLNVDTNHLKMTPKSTPLNYENFLDCYSEVREIVNYSNVSIRE